MTFNCRAVCVRFTFICISKFHINMRNRCNASDLSKSLGDIWVVHDLSWKLVMYVHCNCILQTTHLWANTGVVERGVESTTGDMSVYLLCGIFTSPGIDTSWQIVRDRRLLLSPPKDTALDKQSLQSCSQL